jgi:hypothetical protein
MNPRTNDYRLPDPRLPMAIFVSTGRPASGIPMSMMSVLERDFAAFLRELPQLLQDGENRGKYALVHGEQVDSIWSTIDEALQAGYDRFGIEPFLVKEIIEVEEPRYFSRNVTPCR